MTESLQEMLAEARRPGFHLRKTPESNGPGAPGCWLGGEPTLPPHIDWPFYQVGSYPSVPLHFVGQIALAEVPEMSGLPPMPRKGTLFFFFETVLAYTLGMDDTSARVIYAEDDVSTYPARKMPPIPDVSEFNDDCVSIWYRDEPTKGYARWPFTFEPITFSDQIAFPDNEFWQASVDELLAEQERIKKLTRKDRARGVVPGCSSEFAIHRMFGANLPDAPISGDEWTSLLIVEPDRDLGFTYGDGEPIAFMIRKDELATGNFEAARFC